MTSYPATGRKQLRCPALATVNVGEWLMPIVGSQDARLESGCLVCELAAGHHGSHVALVATAYGGDQWWWLQWDGQRDEPIGVIQIDPCDGELQWARYADDCLLPQGHPDLHSFHLPPLPSLP